MLEAMSIELLAISLDATKRWLAAPRLDRKLIARCWPLSALASNAVSQRAHGPA